MAPAGQKSSPPGPLPLCFLLLNLLVGGVEYRGYSRPCGSDPRVGPCAGIPPRGI